MSETRTAAGLAALMMAAALTATSCSDDATPEASADEAPTAPTAGKTLFTDSFADDRNGWGLPENEQGRSDVESGDFVWESKSPNLRPHLLATPIAEAFDRGELRMQDVVVRSTVTVERGPDAVVGIFCREVRDTDADFQWYEFVARDGYAAIRRGDSAGHLDVLAKTTDVDVSTDEQLALEVACVDDAQGRAGLWFAVGGEQVLYARDAEPLGNGAAGLQAYDSPAEDDTSRFLIRWHDFTVSRPAG